MMLRKYTDPRFPGVQIENDGTLNFSIIESGQVVSTFSGWEAGCKEPVSNDFAQRRAESYFNRMDLSAALAAQQMRFENGDGPKVSPQELERAIAEARATPPYSEHRRVVMERALRLVVREESLPEQVVASLLYER